MVSKDRGLMVPVAANFHFSRCAHPSNGYIQLAPVPLSKRYCELQHGPWKLDEGIMGGRLIYRISYEGDTHISNPTTSRFGSYRSS